MSALEAILGCEDMRSICLDSWEHQNVMDLSELCLRNEMVCVVIYSFLKSPK